ncbi:hypothetical protein DFP72DRAFT_850967 [Ephemerocybe angulata]|uniref:Uncharacterized protein n=1 Tax=Ephemerocybe angulata TaxID=980116 RepID=A0A8H6HRC6_9AGAR|nr:hypothetical protein DFP72DRAFT_850967 [Tulosesus angulatus]
MSSSSDSPSSDGAPSKGSGKEKKIPLDERFNATQLSYLEESRETYRYSTAVQRKELCQQTYEKFIRDMEAMGRFPDKDEKAGVNENVRLWYQQRGRSRRDDIHWGILWVGRQVFYKENIPLVMATQRELYAEAVGVQASEVEVEPPELDAIGDEDGDNEDEVRDTRKPLKPFNFFQKALTIEWKKLSEEEQEKYHKLAIKWRKRGPNEEEKRRLAQYKLAEVMTEFCQNLYKQMGVRLVSLASFTDTKGQLGITTLDFNNKIDGGRSFKSGAKRWWQDSNPELAYGNFIVATKSGEAPGATDTKALVLKRNEYGEPILPDPKKVPRGSTAHRYYVKLLRAYVRGFYATARDVKPTSRLAAPPWGVLSRDIRSLIDEEYFPEKYCPLTDPGIIRVERAGKILKYWYKRQERGEIPLLFHSYIGSDEKVHPAMPRTLRSASSESEEGDGDAVLPEQGDSDGGPAQKNQQKESKVGVPREQKNGGKKEKGEKTDNDWADEDGDDSDEELPVSRTQAKGKTRSKLSVRSRPKKGARERVGKSAPQLQTDGKGPRKGKEREVLSDQELDAGVPMEEDPPMDLHQMDVNMSLSATQQSPAISHSLSMGGHDHFGTPTSKLVQATSKMGIHTPSSSRQQSAQPASPIPQISAPAVTPTPTSAPAVPPIPLPAPNIAGSGHPTTTAPSLIDPQLLQAIVMQQVAILMQTGAMAVPIPTTSPLPGALDATMAMPSIPVPGATGVAAMSIPSSLPPDIGMKQLSPTPTPIPDVTPDIADTLNDTAENIAMPGQILASTSSNPGTRPRPRPKPRGKLGGKTNADVPGAASDMGGQPSGSNTTLKAGRKGTGRGGRTPNAEDRALLAQAEIHGKAGKRTAKPSAKARDRV